MSDKYESLIKEDLCSFFEDVDKLRDIKRYSIAPVNNPETVAEHSFFVATYVLKLYEYFKFDLQKALSLALLHDFSEVFISDVPHPIKKRVPALKTAIEQAEEAVNREMLSDTMADWLIEFNEGSSPEGRAAALADVLSVVSYTKHELILGNSDYMKQVYDKTVSRYIEAVNNMKDDLREGKTTQEVIAAIINLFGKRAKWS